ncbi:Transcription elongation factor [Venturia inaequalis]|nr:Transcription elongation factor [Venturia inaequalis]
MSHLSIRERSTAKQEVDTLATQLLRLRTQIAEVEAAIFEVARLYSTLPLSLRKDTSRLKTSDPQILEACFFDAVETAQDAFWTGVVGQAKWVVLWIERGRDWAGGFGAVLEIDVAGFAIGVVREELMRVESQVKQVKYELLGFSKVERAGFGRQNEEEIEACLEGAVRFLWFWPGTEGWVQRGFMGEVKERERQVSREAVAFLGLVGEEMVAGEEEWGDEDADADTENGTEGSGGDVKNEFFEEGDSGVFLEGGRRSVDSRVTLERG